MRTIIRSKSTVPVVEQCVCRKHMPISGQEAWCWTLKSSWFSHTHVRVKEVLYGSLCFVLADSEALGPYRIFSVTYRALKLHKKLSRSEHQKALLYLQMLWNMDELVLLNSHAPILRVLGPQAPLVLHLIYVVWTTENKKLGVQSSWMPLLTCFLFCKITDMNPSSVGPMSMPLLPDLTSLSKEKFCY